MTAELRQLMLHLLDMFGELLGILKTCEVWYLVYKVCGGSVPGKLNIQYYAPSATPLLTSKACPEIQEDSYWSNPSMNWELITGHFGMHFYVFSLWSSPLAVFLTGCYSTQAPVKCLKPTLRLGFASISKPRLRRSFSRGISGILVPNVNVN